MVYKFRPGKVKAEIGISILNVLNTDNFKYSNLRRTTIDEVNLVGIYAEAVSFTPAVFLKSSCLQISNFFVPLVNNWSNLILPSIEE